MSGFECERCARGASRPLFKSAHPICFSIAAATVLAFTYKRASMFLVGISMSFTSLTQGLPTSTDAERVQSSFNSHRDCASCHLSKVHFDGRISSLDCRQSTNLARNPGLGMKATFRPNESLLSFRWCFVGITTRSSVSVIQVGECESGEDIYAKRGP